MSKKQAPGASRVMAGRLLRARQPVSVEEAAEQLQVNPETLRRWARSGILPSVRWGKGGKLWFRATDLKAFKG